MDPRALRRLTLLVGVLVLASAFIMARRVHTEERNAELAIISALAAGIFLTVAGVISLLTEPPAPDVDDYDELDEPEGALPAVAEWRPPRATFVASLVGIFLIVVAAVIGAIVGAADRDVGTGLQTFTAALILGGVVLGVGLLLGYRPSEETEAQ